MEYVIKNNSVRFPRLARNDNPFRYSEEGYQFSLEIRNIFKSIHEY